MREMKILGKVIALSHDNLDIQTLKFLKDNPRVYACTHGKPNFGEMPDEEQQDFMFDALRKEPSVKNLIPEIKRHGGLMESILVRHDTMEVIEGNSRLAVYRHLQNSGVEGEWDLIPCDIVSSLTENQQAAFLNQIHVKGKTKWSAYEKANFAYVRKERGDSFSNIANLFGESEATIRIRIKAIEMMKNNTDNERPHFSYYDVLVRNREIQKGMEKAGGFEKLLSDIKNLGADENSNTFTAQDLRNKLPVVLKKPKVLRKYVAREVDLDEAYQRAKISDVEENIKQATALLSDVSNDKVSRLESNRFNAFKQATKKLSREVNRIEKMTQAIGDSK